MFLTSKNNLLYDVQNFDKYSNIYVIMIDNKQNKHKYKIIYGHYYNNQNIFLYKRTIGANIISKEIFGCFKHNLFHNEENDLIYSYSYETIKRYLKLIINNEFSQ